MLIVNIDNDKINKYFLVLVSQLDSRSGNMTSKGGAPTVKKIYLVDGTLVCVDGCSAKIKM